ncbi:MAG: ATP-grasp domain-containing protein [Chloroflexota bacterium]
MSTLMVLGAGDEHLHVIRAAKGLKHRVIVVDPDPTRPGVALGDAHVACSLLDIAAVLDAACAHHIDGITTASLGIGMRTIGAVAEALDLPGLRRDSAYAVTDKIVMHERLRGAQVDDLPYRVAVDVASAQRAVHELGLPVVVKPADGSGSRGVRVVRDEDEIVHAYQGAVTQTRSPERGTQVLIEAFIDGDDLNGDGFIVDGVVHVVTLRAAAMTPLPHRQEVGYLFPPPISPQTEQAVMTLLARVTRALALDNTPFHVDMKIRPDGQPALIEIGARLPGYGLSTDFIPHATGLDVARTSVMLALGQPLDLGTLRRTPTCMFFLQPKTGKIVSGIDLAGLRARPGVVAVYSKLKPGDIVEPVIDGATALHQGYIVTTASTVEQAHQQANAAAHWFYEQLIYTP